MIDPRAHVRPWPRSEGPYRLEEELAVVTRMASKTRNNLLELQPTSRNIGRYWSDRGPLRSNSESLRWPGVFEKTTIYSAALLAPKNVQSNAKNTEIPKNMKIKLTYTLPQELSPSENVGHIVKYMTSQKNHETSH